MTAAPNSHEGYPVKATLSAALLICYSVLIHLAVLEERTGMVFLMLATPVVLLVVRSRLLALLLGMGVVLALLLGADAVIERGPPLFYLPPILIHLMLAWHFGRTLRSGRTPLITQYSIILRGNLAPEIVVYTRRVTSLWTAFFLALTGESLLLALFAPIEVWSLFTNILNYIFTITLFVGEYMYRLRRLSGFEHPHFLRFLAAITSSHVSKINRP